MPRPPWTVPAPDGTPYHRLGRTSLHRWWRPLLGTGFFLLGATLVTIMLGVVGATVRAALDDKDPGDSGPFFSNPTANLAFNLLWLALLTPIVLLAAWLIQRRPLMSVTSVTGRLRMRWLLACLGLTVVATLLSFSVVSITVTAFTSLEEGQEGSWAGWADFLPPAAVIIALVPFQAAAEEYVFRGWLLQAVGAYFRNPWPAIVISATPFALLHLQYSGWALLSVFFLGLAAGWLAVRTGGLEAPIALHVINNYMAFLVIAGTGEMDSAFADTGGSWLAAPTVLTQLLLCVLLVWLAGRRMLGDAHRNGTRFTLIGMVPVGTGQRIGRSPADGTGLPAG